MELQVSYRVCAEISEKSVLRWTQAGSTRDIKKTLRVERRGDHRGRSVSGSCAYSCIDPAQNERFGIYGISEKKECDDHISKMGKYEIRIPKPRILVQGILCGYCHISLWILLRGEKFFGICTLKNKRISECGKRCMEGWKRITTFSWNSKVLK